MKLHIVITTVNTNSKGDGAETASSVSAFDMVERKCVYYTHNTTDDTNVATAGYRVLYDFFDWLEAQSGYRNKMELVFVSATQNVNSSLMKMGKAFYTLRKTWAAMITDLVRKGAHNKKELMTAKHNVVKKILTANHKAADEMVKYQTGFVFGCLDILNARYGMGFELWTISLTDLWKGKENDELREIVKEEKAKLIALAGMSDSIVGIKKYKEKRCKKKEI